MSSSGEPGAYLFVYGTLRREAGTPQGRRLLMEAAWVGPARAPGRLYDLGRYPGMKAAQRGDAWVLGEVYRLEDGAKTLAWLDAYEGIESGFYERRVVPVRLEAGGELTAWCYFLKGSVPSAQRIDSGDYFAR